MTSINKDLADAVELLHAGLLLRMHGDITHLPMSQAEWDSKTEAFLRSLDEDAEGAVTRRSLPVGTVLALGHPGDNRLVVQSGFGWRYLHNLEYVPDDVFRDGWTLHKSSNED